MRKDIHSRQQQSMIVVCSPHCIPHSSKTSTCLQKAILNITTEALHLTLTKNNKYIHPLFNSKVLRSTTKENLSHSNYQQTRLSHY